MQGSLLVGALDWLIVGCSLHNDNMTFRGWRARTQRRQLKSENARVGCRQ